jgi:serine/threonine-protein kinase HipA
MLGYVYKQNRLAATLARESEHTVFRYDPAYLEAGGAPVASTLPLSENPITTPGSSVPAFFAGLLPEGRRLGALVRNTKTSVEDELGLLLAIGPATVGDVYTQAEESAAHEYPQVKLPRDAKEIDFAEIITRRGISLSPRLAGVQDKASAQMISFHASKSEVNYILKFDPPEFAHLSRNEMYFIKLANKLKINVSQAQLISDRTGAEALLVKRFDRNISELIHQEDGMQVLGRYPGDKYLVSFEEVATALSANTLSAPASTMNLLTQLLFAWLTGNGDLHGKNLSLIGDSEKALISPMYDMPSSLFYPDVNPDLALKVGGQFTLTPKRFASLGAELGLPAASIEKIRAKVLKVTADLANDISAGALPFDSKINSKAARQLSRRHLDFSRGL